MNDDPVNNEKDASGRMRRLTSPSPEDEQALWDELLADALATNPSNDLPPAESENLSENEPARSLEPPEELTGYTAAAWAGAGQGVYQTGPGETDLEGASDPQPAQQPASSTPQSALPSLRPVMKEGDTKPVRVQPGLHLPALGASGLPLPRRVDEIDLEATSVSATAYAARPRPAQTRQGQSGPAAQPIKPRPYTPPPPPRSAGYQQPPPPQQDSLIQRNWGCIVRLAIIGVFVIVLGGLCGASVTVLQYLRIRSGLPDVTQLELRASQFETTRILDRNGSTLYEILDPNAGRRTYVPLERISPYLLAATIATEDKEFYNHPGFDIFAIFRAFLQNSQSGETVSGASTITQQLARNLLFSPEERAERTYNRKIREAVLASELTRVYSKDKILELYLNENYYGNMAYGVEAAAQTYFGTSADRLTLGQSSFLAGLPQAPAIYDVYTNREATLKRHEDVLVLMYQMSLEKGCITVSNTPQPICLDPVAAATAANELKDYVFHSPDFQIRYPHWVTYVRTLLEAQYDPQTIYRSGFTVYTTLDPNLQDIAEQVVKTQVQALSGRNANDGALVAIKPATGEILAMVGSADFYNEAISGQVNMAVSPRQPGSSIKPLTYTAAFERGWTPATLIWDVPSEFTPSGKPDDPSPPYKPVNYDGRFHGPVTVRYALANSYNIPAVKTLQYVGIYDDPDTTIQDGFLAFARRMGISTLTRPDYGLSLTLGGGDVTLLELTSAYAIFANNGRRIPPVAITRILDYTGAEVYTYQQPQGDPAVRPEHAYLISSILSDNEARTPAFGRNSPLRLPFTAAVKTGTTNDFRDNWTLGYTPDLAVGVWVGNADYTPMQNISGVEGAAPIWNQFMQLAIQALVGGNPTPFSRPPSVMERVICAVSGSEPSDWCPQQRTELFASDQLPLPSDQDLWQRIEIDTWTGLIASPVCDEFTDERFVINVKDTFARRWIRREPAGQEWAQDMGFQRPITFAPERECTSDDPRPKLQFASPRNGDTILSSPLEIFGQAGATANFDRWRLEYGLGEDPAEWEVLADSESQAREGDRLGRWELEDMQAGIITLRLLVFSTEETQAELRIRINLQVPTPTPTPTLTPRPTETPTPTFTPEPSATPGAPPSEPTETPPPDVRPSTSP